MSLILVYIFSLCSEQYQNINTGGNMALRQFLLLFKDNFEKDRKQQTWKKTETQQNVSPIFCALLVHVTPSGQLSHALTIHSSPKNTLVRRQLLWTCPGPNCSSQVSVSCQTLLAQFPVFSDQPCYGSTKPLPICSLKGRQLCKICLSPTEKAAE